MAKKKSKPDFSKPKESLQQADKTNLLENEEEPDFITDITYKDDVAPEDKEYEGLPLVVIAGRPNVGKSTLFNRFLKKRVAITNDQPGVTRDPVEATAILNDKPVHLVDTGGSLIGCIDILKEHGARKVYCAATHGVFSHNALERIAASDIEEFVITNTIEHPEERVKNTPNLKVLSVGFLLAKSIEAISNNKPISDVYNLFQ